MKKKSEVNPMTVDTSDMLKSIFDTFSGLDYIRPEDIPNIDLYMDQVTTFMEDPALSRGQDPHQDHDQQLCEK